MKKFILLLPLFILFTVTPLLSLAEQEGQEKEISFVKEIFNFHIIDPNVMRGSQPSEESLKLLKDYLGLKTIIDLRGNNKETAGEAKIAKKLGIDFISIPMSARTEQDIADIEKSISIMHDKSRQPVFVHCHSGKDRTGMVCAAYRIKYDNWTFEEALTEMLAYGFSRSCCLPLEESLSEWNALREKNSGR